MSDDYINHRPNAWARWGAQDEAGALNHIGAAQVLRATGLVRTGEVIRLAQPLSKRCATPGATVACSTTTVKTPCAAPPARPGSVWTRCRQR